jgi:hypothetical protein
LRCGRNLRGGAGISWPIGDEHVARAASQTTDARDLDGIVVAIYPERLVLKIVAVAIAPRPQPSNRERKQNASAAKQGEHLRVLPALVVNLVHVAVALVVGILRFDVEYLGLVQELEVEAEHFLVLGVLGVVSL